MDSKRLAEIAALPDRRDNTTHDDVDANYAVGKLMAEAIRELLLWTHDMECKLELKSEKLESANAEIERLKVELSQEKHGVDYLNLQVREKHADLMRLMTAVGPYSTVDSAIKWALRVTREWRLYHDALARIATEDHEARSCHYGDIAREVLKSTETRKPEGCCYHPPSDPAMCWCDCHPKKGL